MKFFISPLLAVEESSVLPSLQFRRITVDGLRRLIVAGNKEEWDALLVDPQMIRDGEALVAHLAAHGPIVIVGEPSDELIRFADRVDAFAFLPPPLRVVDLRILESRIAFRAHRQTEERVLTGASRGQFIAVSPKMKEIVSLVDRLSPFSTTVMLYGESGTGKEVIARMLHEGSPRSEGSFIAVNCGAIPEGLVESELFGHKRGSFTDASRDKPGLFAEASGGTLFLDEIGELPLTIQAKLLRALQENKIRPVGGEAEVPVDVRVIAATLKDLQHEVAEGAFREDLFYRLNVVTIHLPPLRERSEDIPALAEFFLKKHRKRHRLKVQGFSSEAMQRLKSYPWRGNVRELENCVERGLVLTEGDIIDIDSLPPSMGILSSVEEDAGTLISEDEISIKKVSREIEITLIQRALERTNGNRTQAAKLLEISHRALLYKIKEYGLGE